MRIFNNLRKNNYSDPNPVSVSTTGAFMELSTQISECNRYVLGFLPMIKEIHLHKEEPDDIPYEYTIYFDNKNQLGPLNSPELLRAFDYLYSKYEA